MMSYRSNMHYMHVILISKHITNYIKLQLGLVLGLMLAITLGVGLQYGAKLFTSDVKVLHLISISIPVSFFFSFSFLSAIKLLLLKLYSFPSLKCYIYIGVKMHVFYFMPVCCSYSTYKCLGVCL